MRCRQALAILVVLVLLIAACFTACGEAVRRRGRLHVPAREFYASASFPLAPFNLWCGRHTAGGDPPYPPLALHFPRHETLRARWEVIRDEALAVIARGLATPIKGDRFFRDIADGGWKKFYIKWYGPSGADARALCPRTVALLEALPEVRLAMFSVLEPGARIRPHVGPFAGAKRYHLGLSCPPEAHILVDGHRYTWRDGEDVLFDDTYVHEVVNASASRARIVLFCDVETAMTGPFSSWAARKACDLLGPLTTRANDKTEARSRAP